MENMKHLLQKKKMLWDLYLTTRFYDLRKIFVSYVTISYLSEGRGCHTILNTMPTPMESSHSYFFVKQNIVLLMLDLLTISGIINKQNIALLIF